MSAEKSRPKAAYIPLDVLYDKRLGSLEKILVALLPQLEAESDNQYKTRGMELAYYLQSTERTVLRSLNNLERCGYLNVKRKEGRKGGLFISFRSRSLLASILFALSVLSQTAGARLQNSAYSKLQQSQKPSADYIPRRKRKTGSFNEPKDLSHLGQLGSWAAETLAAARAQGRLQNLNYCPR